MPRLAGCALILWTVLSAQQAPDPLLKALELSDFYNWAEAEPWFEKAKASAGNDGRRALYAELGFVRATMERRVLPETSEWLATQLRQNPLLMGDDELRLFALMVKADIDFEIDVRPARTDWEEARAIAERRKDSKWLRRSEGELGFIYFVEGDVTRSTKSVVGALVAAKQANDIGAQIRYLSGIGTGLTMIRNHQAGLDRIDQALALEAANQPLAGYNFPVREGKVMALLGLDRKDEAYALGAELLEQAKARGKRVKECQLFLILGKHFRDEGNRQQAVLYFTQARDLAEAGQFTRLLANAYNALALARLEEGNKTAAIELAMKAARTTQASGDLYLLPDRLFTVAQLQVGLGRIAEAKATFEAAEEAATLVRSWATSAQTRVSLVNTMSALYREHFLLYARDKDVANAFRVLETSRALTMREVILASDKMLSAEKISSLRSTLARSGEIADLRRAQATVAADQQSSWTDVQRRIVQPVDLPEIQRGLSPKAVLLEYALAEPSSYCVVITKTNARIVPLPMGTKALTALVTQYSDALKQNKTDDRLAEELYQVLLAPVMGTTKQRELLVSRDGALHLIPFEALVGPDKQYAIMSHEISYVPSASTLRLLQGLPAKQGSTSAFLGVGGLQYDTSTRPQIAATRGYETKLKNLPGSAQEVRNAADSIAPGRAKLLLGADGTESAFKRTAPGYRIIHLAVHGRANSLYPDRAALVLLPDAVAKEDGLLDASEIVQLRIAADMVVLSACDTAVGMLLGQDGVANLSRAFLAGGTRTVISTLWAADDISATTLLKRFYAELESGKDVAHSLTAAKRDLIKTFRAPPYFWAPYIVEGLGGLRVQ